MHHGQRATQLFDTLAVSPWLILAAIAIAAVIGLLIWLFLREDNHLTAEESGPDEVAKNIHGQIMAMLHQAGCALRQTDIAANLGVSVDRVAAALHELEREGRITRQWHAADYTYAVRSR